MSMIEDNLPVYLMHLGMAALVVVVVWSAMSLWNTPAKRDDRPWESK